MQKAITQQEVEQFRQQNQRVILIDIRPHAEFEKMHVPGSSNMPAETINENISTLSANDLIVCICTKGLDRSQNAAETISSMGFKNVFYLKEGVIGWNNK